MGHRIGFQTGTLIHSRFRLPFSEMRTQLRPDSLTCPLGQFEKRLLLSRQQLWEVTRIANLDSERAQHFDALQIRRHVRADRYQKV